MNTSFSRRSLAVAGCAGLVLSMLGQVAIVAAGPFIDLSDSFHYAEAINALSEKGIIRGYGDGTYRAEAGINRAEFVKIVVLAAYTEAQIDDLLSRVRLAQFPDVPSGEWYARYVMFAQAKGIIAGYPDGTFHPAQNVNFVEASKIISLAFNHTPQDSGGEWYEMYVRALESSKAIPPTVAKLDSRFTRGEMAETMWRLIEKKDDRETKGLLNLKHPDAKINFASDTVQRATMCADLRAFAEEMASTQQSMDYREGRMMEMGGAVEDAAGAPAPTTAEKSANLPLTGGGGDGDYSQTNVQVAGVDEADVVKTDGEYLYFLRGTQLRIVKAKPATDLRETAMIDFTGKSFQPSELYVDGDVLVVIGSEWRNYPVPMYRETMGKMMAPSIWPPWQGGMSRTRVMLYDVSDAAKPKLTRELSFEGSSISTRRIGDDLYLVLQQPMRWGGPMPLAEENILPVYSDSAKGATDRPIAECDDVLILPHIPQPQYMTVAVIPTDSPTGAIDTDVILGNAQNVYMSLDNLYVATTEWNYVWDSSDPQSSEKTNIYRFSVDADGVSFATKGSVPGHILNQFSMDEHGSTGLTTGSSYFRIATTTSPAWNERLSSKSSNALYVLNMDMETVGEIEDIAPGETIFSARFMGDRAYMVTFKQVDPLFVIDTSNPRAPKILGKLKIPGYSNYLHPYDENHVIGFGKEIDESIDKDKVHSDDAVYYTAIQGVKISMFDVTDVEHPKELHKELIGDRGTESEVLNNHRALLFEKDRGLMAFPILVATRPAGTAKSEAGVPTFQGAYVYDVSLKDGFERRGTITHYASDTFKKAGDYWYGGDRDIQRIVRVGESLYTISDDAVQAHTEESVNQQDTLELAK